MRFFKSRQRKRFVRLENRTGKGYNICINRNGEGRMALTAYCKKCAREVDAGEICPFCGSRLGKNAAHAAWCVERTPVKDWMCWNALMRVLLPAALFILLLVLAAEGVSGGVAAVEKMLVSGFPAVLLSLLGAIVLLVFAALTSTISMHEIGTAFFHEELKMKRGSAAWILTIVCSVICVFCSLSVGAVDGIRLFGMSLMDFCDFLTAQVMLPAGALLTSIMIGWVVGKRAVRDEFTNGGTVSQSLFTVWRFSVRYVVPLCILLIFLHQFGLI